MCINLKIKRNRVKGFTLVELLVAMTLSLLIVLGVTAVLIQSKSSYKYQEALARAQANGSAAIAVLEQELRLAGYPADPLNSVGGIKDTSTVSSVAITYKAPVASYQNCVGTTSIGNDVDVQFSIGTQSGITGLLCNNNILSENVTTLTFSYGEDTDADGLPNGYVAAASVSNWRNVVSIRTAISVDTENDDLSDLTFSTTVPLRNQRL